ncbi:MAG TPA: hypothetical protein EYM71_02835 [Rhodospirillales bacterium]|jgi:hypothetical protein|nr:MAG: hypothetical protein CFH03_00986 [Alphaproteobacteria bacterium MarineAlpha3_Bin2]HIC29969.1 hypothetical protein [Rhodospirillales bacterium]HIE19763.1 hypothetical protein [Rhodospirillales bacterium]HIM25237.1 hypothetical protein [Rhodospirillales bacterium]HIN20785.1 hypothetical protein [Rhodospirillales bacterium]
MPYTLTELAGDVRAILSQSEASACSDDLCKLVSKALNDPEFTSTHLTDRRDGEGPREVLFEDDELGFCICGHVYGDQAIGKPHDHGSSWALYGQAEGTTEMTDWKIVRKGDGDDPSIVEPNKTYTMNPGDAHFYGIGNVHSPKRTAPTKLVRIEGVNLDHMKRSKIVAAS